MISPFLLAASAPVFKPSASLEEIFLADMQAKADTSPEKHMPTVIEEERRKPLKRARDGAILESFTLYPGRKGPQLIPKRHLMRPTPTFGPVKLNFRMFSIQPWPTRDSDSPLTEVVERKGYAKSDSVPRKIYPTPLSEQDKEEVKKLGGDVVIRLGKTVLVVDEPQGEKGWSTAKLANPLFENNASDARPKNTRMLKSTWAIQVPCLVKS
jgi:hypothetical protein